MAFPAPLGGFAWKFVSLANVLGHGFSDVIYYQNKRSPATTGWADAQAAAISFANALNFERAQPTLAIGVRVTLLDNTKPLLPSAQQSDITATGNFPGASYPGGFKQPVQLANVSALVRLETKPPSCHRQWEYAGLSNSTLTQGGADPGVMDVGGIQLAGYVGAIATKLNWNGQGIPQGSGWDGVFCIKAILRPDTIANGVNATPSIQLQGVTSSANPGYQNYVVNTADLTPQWKVGFRFAARGTKLSCAKGYNGQRIVTGRVDGQPLAGQSTIQTLSCWKCNGAPMAKLLGIIYPTVYGLYAIGNTELQGVNTRKRGRPLGQSAGRRPACAC